MHYVSMTLVIQHSMALLFITASIARSAFRGDFPYDTLGRGYKGGPDFGFFGRPKAGRVAMVASSSKCAG